MKATLLSAVAALLSAGAVLADSTTTTSSAAAATTCDAESILDACLTTTTGYIALCASSDYSCLCDKYIDVMTCFNNCPNDSRAATYESEKDLYCMNASLYGSTTIMKTSSGTAATATGNSKGTGTGGTANPTATDSGDDDDSDGSSDEDSPIETGEGSSPLVVGGDGGVTGALVAVAAVVLAIAVL